MTAAAKVARALAVPVALVLAVLGQLAVVNRAPLPGGAAPDLVLLMVVAVAVNTGPLTGMLAGFAGGLALDVAPPAGHLAGQYALVFCLTGYACGRIRSAISDAGGEHTTVTALTVMAAGVAIGEAGKAALGMMLSDPGVTGPAVKHVLPAAILYDLLLCPFVLWLTSAALRRPAPERAPRPDFSHAPRLAPAFRLATAGAAPGLRLAGSSGPMVPPPVRPEPKLRLAAGRSSSLARTHAASSAAALPGGRTVKLNFAGSGRGNSLGGASALRTPQPLPGKSPGKGWLRPARPAGTETPRLKSPASGWLRAPKPAQAPRLKSPASGWLRAAKPAGPAAPRLKSPASGWLRAPKPAQAPRLKSPARGWLRPAKPARQTWYSKSPSTRWLRRNRSPWPGRGRRLRRLLGGRR
jgi:rod shape-determining protein MreD